MTVAPVVPAKPWYQSKTIWLMVVLFLVAALPLVQPALAAFVSPDMMTKIQTVMTAVIAVLGIVVRFLTDAPIST